MTESITPADGATGGPNATSNQGPADPNFGKRFPDANQGRSASVVVGNAYTNWLIGLAVGMLLVGVIVWASNSGDGFYDDGNATASLFGVALMQFAALAALLGIHALAVRAPRT